MNQWQNYGDIDFIEYGGCLVKADEYQDCFHVLVLETEIYVGKEEQVIVAKCYIDLSTWIEDEDTRKQINFYAGYKEDYIPQTEDEKMSYCVDLINCYGIQEFAPEFPKETSCGPYTLGTVVDWIVEKEVAIRFMKELDIPEEYLN